MLIKRLCHPGAKDGVAEHHLLTDRVQLQAFDVENLLDCLGELRRFLATQSVRDGDGDNRHRFKLGPLRFRIVGDQQ